MLSALLPHVTGPLLTAFLLARRIAGIADHSETRERNGYIAVPDDAADRVWLHGASNGELTSARPVVAGLLHRHPELRIVVTSNSASGRSLALGWGYDRLSVGFAPIDSKAAVRRFLDRAQPRAVIIVENEIWPNRLFECARRGTPVAIIGARMSDRAARRWALLPGLARRLFAIPTLVWAQDSATGPRLVALGLPADRLGPVLSLKSLAKSTAVTAPHPSSRDRTILAASTHEGEDEIVLTAFASVRRFVPDLRLILAPRHPRRRDSIEALLRQHDLKFSTRSKGEAPDADRAVYLADTLGEMDNWYAAAAITFVGGSLSDDGGHTPYEPAAHGTAIVTGRKVANFADPYARLAEAGAALFVTDAEELAFAFQRLLDPTISAAQVRAARGVLLAGSGPDVEPILDGIDRLAGLSASTHGQ